MTEKKVFKGYSQDVAYEILRWVIDNNGDYTNVDVVVEIIKEGE